MKNVAKVVALAIALMPLVFLTGCNKKCGENDHHRLDKMKEQYGGK